MKTLAAKSTPMLTASQILTVVATCNRSEMMRDSSSSMPVQAQVELIEKSHYQKTEAIVIQAKSASLFCAANGVFISGSPVARWRSPSKPAKQDHLPIERPSSR